MEEMALEKINNAQGVIIIPYAYGGNTGVSIQNSNKQLEIYLKNVCTASLSAKLNAGKDSDIMVVTNITIPEPYITLLTLNDIKVEFCKFDNFNFGPDFGGNSFNWQLAFYKLCALDHCINSFDYPAYCFLDSDVFIQRSFKQIWEEANEHILLYDLTEPSDGYMIKEMQEFMKSNHYFSHYGGEFFAASNILSQKFIDECRKVFEEIKSSGYVTKSGDEFITSIVADRLKMHVKNAGAYIRRYWTGSYRLICNDYSKNNIIVLHLPAEKEQGILKIFNRYISKSIVPSNQTVWKTCHLNKMSLRVRLGLLCRKIGLVK